MGSKADDYRFLQIVDAMASINQRVNLIGLVVETSISEQSKCTGNTLSLWIFKKLEIECVCVYVIVGAGGLIGIFLLDVVFVFLVFVFLLIA
ncbi:hypothetical protein Acr_08g0007690 [Actinidia rufa]|uniref:Uncharacterized protein n=1 Tax=Actinidia rufa TaxID=165716 RepID=A0A7J0F179_9ERIC|nr:hypothetical protein Acr_08g0007690 [Actinidia rufa]